MKGEKIRLKSVEVYFSKVDMAIIALLKARNRLKELSPLKEDYSWLQKELSEANRQKQLQKDMDELLSRSASLKERNLNLETKVTSILKDLVELGDLNILEERLLGQENDLDRLGTELNNILADLRGEAKVKAIAKSEILRNLSRVKSLGEGGVCPTCETS